MNTQTQTSDCDWLSVAFDSSHGVGLSFPTIQWYNARDPDLAAIHPVLGNGGWEWPLDSFARATATGVQPAGFSEPRDVRHRNGQKVVKAMLAEELSVAVLAVRASWRNKDTGLYIGKGYQPGMNVEKVMNLLVYLRGIETISPVVLTLSGRGSTTAIKDTLQAFDREVVALASSLKRQPVPRYAFWLTLRSGGPKEIKSARVSESSMATPPCGIWDREALGDPVRRLPALTAMFVGKKVKALCEQTYALAQAWAKQYTQQVASGVVDDGPEPPEEHSFEDIPY